MNLYPLVFEPKYHYRIWAGDKLKTVLHKQYDQESVGESWEISAVTGSETIVTNGDLKGKTINELMDLYGAQFLGASVKERFKDEFPLLIKFIDAKTPLSIQVHPHDALARERHNSFGKNEMWYIMESDQEAEIVVGFNKQIDKKEYQEHLENNTIASVMNSIKVSNGDTFYIPTGRVHAIGAGVLLAEIQQSSDVTYRIYDYDRVDATTGKKRELHTELSLEAIDFEIQDHYDTAYTTGKNEVNKLVHSPYFTTNVIHLTTTLKRSLEAIDSFVIYICVDGETIFTYKEKTYSIKKGQSILMPAALQSIEMLSENAKLLETYI